jgi:hypothetical protein
MRSMHTGITMTKKCVTFAAIGALLAAFGGEAVAQQKLAQTGMKFLNVGLDARSTALGDATTSIEGFSDAVFSNPAAMARLGTTATASFGNTQWIADINHWYGSVAFAPWGGDLGVLGVFMQAVDYGELQETILAANDAGYLDIGTFRPSGIVFGVSYARAVNDQFSVGGSVKYASQSLGDATIAIGQPKQSNTVGTLAFDFGILYKTGFRSLNFGMTVRNFSREIRFQQENFQLPLTFKIGVSMDVVDLTSLDHDMHGLLVTLDAEHPRDYPEQVRIGAEYLFMKTLALRIGYVSPADEYHVSYGLGLKRTMLGLEFGLDYAYTPFSEFAGVHRWSFRFGI